MSRNVTLKSFSVGAMDNNVYIVLDPATSESVLFDAPTDASRILKELQGTTLKYILMTHTDSDHVQALAEVKSATGAPVGVHPADEQGLPVAADFQLGDGDTLTFGATSIKVMHTPGHTPGGVAFLVDDLLIAGDTLFPGGPGNTQRPDGDFQAIIEAIRTKLLVLPDETQVLPGHGKPTTIGAEKPHLQEWITRGH